MWPKSMEKRKPGIGATWNPSFHGHDSGNHLASACSGQQLHLWEQGAKPRTGLPVGVLLPAPEGTQPCWQQPSWEGQSCWGALLLSSALFSCLWIWTSSWTQWSLCFLNSGILDSLLVAVDLPGKGPMPSSTQQPSFQSVEGTSVGW